MNYYEHHIGDYAEATAHLTFVEDAAYARMIRKYYAQEKPLPAEAKAVQRLVGARSKEEREAVETVLSEFFKLEADGWHNSRCDSELERYLGKTEDKDAKRENERERQRRHRQRRKDLFAALRDIGEVPPFETSNDDLQTLMSRVTGQSVTQNVTRDITANQSPVTSHQTKDLKPEPDPARANTDSPSSIPAPAASAVGSLCVAMRSNGVETQPADPRMIALAAQGVQPDTVAAACAEAKKSKPGERITSGYVLAILSRWSTQAAALDVGGATQPRAGPGYQTPNEKAKAWADRLTGKTKNEHNRNIIDLNDRPA